MRKPVLGFMTRSNAHWPGKSQKKTWGLKFGILNRNCTTVKGAQRVFCRYYTTGRSVFLFWHYVSGFLMMLPI